MNKKAKSSLLISLHFVYIYFVAEAILAYYNPVDPNIIALLNLLSGSQFITLFFAGFFALDFIVNLKNKERK